MGRMSLTRRGVLAGVAGAMLPSAREATAQTGSAVRWSSGTEDAPDLLGRLPGWLVWEVPLTP